MVTCVNPWQHIAKKHKRYQKAKTDNFKRILSPYCYFLTMYKMHYKFLVYKVCPADIYLLKVNNFPIFLKIGLEI